MREISWKCILTLQGHEDHVFEKWHNSTKHCDVVHRLILQLQAMKTPDAKAAVDKEWENRGYCQHGKNQKSSKELSIRHRKSQKQFIVQRPWTCATSKTIDWTRSSKYIQAVLCNVATLWKTTQARVLCSPSRDLPRHTGQPPKFCV